MSEATTPIRVFLLDDHEVVRQGLRALLESGGDIEVVGESGLAIEAAARIPALRPHVAVLDARLPDGSGIEVNHRLKSEGVSLPVIFITGNDNPATRVAAMASGCLAYLTKPFVAKSLIEPIERAAAGLA